MAGGVAAHGRRAAIGCGAGWGRRAAAARGHVERRGPLAAAPRHCSAPPGGSRGRGEGPGAALGGPAPRGGREAAAGLGGAACSRSRTAGQLPPLRWGNRSRRAARGEPGSGLRLGERRPYVPSFRLLMGNSPRRDFPQPGSRSSGAAQPPGQPRTAGPASAFSARFDPARSAPPEPPTRTYPVPRLQQLSSTVGAPCSLLGPGFGLWMHISGTFP